MKLGMYSIFDRKAESYASPFYAANDAAAMRLFVMEGQRDESMIRMFPSDYELCCVGDFDDQSGLVSAPPKGVRQLLTGSDVKRLSTLPTSAGKENEA